MLKNGGSSKSRGAKVRLSRTVTEESAFITDPWYLTRFELSAMAAMLQGCWGPRTAKNRHACTLFWDVLPTTKTNMSVENNSRKPDLEVLALPTLIWCHQKEETGS
jgi:hypothetical protein